MTADDPRLDRTFDIAYAHRDGTPLLLDLTKPVGVPEPPLVLYLHSGGWRMGDRRSDASRWERLCKFGFAVASADYRLSTAATFPAQLEDVRAALVWLYRHGAELGVRSDRLCVWGASAGAHLAMLLAYDTDDAVVAEVPIAAAAGFFGTYDVTAAARRGRFAADATLPDFWKATGKPWPQHPTFEAMLLGVDDVAEAPDLAVSASPSLLVHAGGPPVLLMHGEQDGLASPDQSRWMFDAVRSVGGSAALMLLAGANHEDDEFSSDTVIGATAAFFLEHSSAARPDDRCRPGGMP